MRLRKRCQAEFYNSLEYESIEKIVKANGFEYGNIESGNGDCLLYVKERMFSIPACEHCDPNNLLKYIVTELYWDDDKKYMLQSINGVLSGMNSTYKSASREELYNWVKYRFMTDERYREFFVHPLFDKYIVNKINKMIAMRK